MSEPRRASIDERPRVLEIPRERLLQDWKAAYDRACAYLEALGVPENERDALATRAVELALTRFGGLQGLVNCAGIGNAAKVLGKEGPQPLAEFSRSIQINLVGSFNMIRLAADAMAKAVPNASGERGVIVNTASVAAFDGQIGQCAYAASKAGVAGLTLPNPASLALHEKFGFRKVGVFHAVGRKFDQYWDVAWFERPLRLSNSL